jgi:hypothetical protein
MAYYRKKPVVIMALQWTGENLPIIRDFLGNAFVRLDNDSIAINTLEGITRASVNDWVIRGVQGEFYPCKPSIFASTYEPVE